MGIRILIVDDEEDTLGLLRTILSISGFEPITTLNSLEAVGLAEISKPDVVLLDIMMPRLDGFTLCKLLREKPSTKTMPIIFVTAYESLDLEERRIEAGANLVIRKPIDLDVLVQSIASILKPAAAAGSPVAAAEPAAVAVPPTTTTSTPAAVTPPVVGTPAPAVVVPPPGDGAAAKPVSAPAPTPIRTQEHEKTEAKPSDGKQ